jgi:hypothetical protein
MPPFAWTRAAALALLLSGCTGIGPQRLDTDQMLYAASLGEGLKRQMLLNIIRLRNADVPTFLSVSQVIAGYTLEGAGQVGLNAYPNANPGNYATIAGTLQYTTRPTFTFTPVTGQRFAYSYLRPVAAAELLSLAQSGVPVDLLFRLGVSSVNGLRNRRAAGGDGQPAAERFDALMHALRQVQTHGAVGLRFDRQPVGGHVHVLLEGDDPRAATAIRDVQRALGLGAAREFEVVYGRSPGGPGQVAILTRSVLQVLYELGAPADGAGEALLTLHQGPREPTDAFAAVPYRGSWFWIAADDRRSKTVFAFAHVLQVLAESSAGQSPPVVTIPAQ